MEKTKEKLKEYFIDFENTSVMARDEEHAWEVCEKDMAEGWKPSISETSLNEDGDEEEDE